MYCPTVHFAFHLVGISLVFVQSWNVNENKHGSIQWYVLSLHMLPVTRREVSASFPVLCCPLCSSSLLPFARLPCHWLFVATFIHCSLSFHAFPYHILSWPWSFMQAACGVLTRIPTQGCFSTFTQPPTNLLGLAPLVKIPLPPSLSQVLVWTCLFAACSVFPV